MFQYPLVALFSTTFRVPSKQSAFFSSQQVDNSMSCTLVLARIGYARARSRESCDCDSVEVIETHNLGLAYLAAKQVKRERGSEREVEAKEQPKHKFSRKRAFKISLHLWSLKFKMPFKNSTTSPSTMSSCSYLCSSSSASSWSVCKLHESHTPLWLQRMRQVKSAPFG